MSNLFSRAALTFTSFSACAALLVTAGCASMGSTGSSTTDPRVGLKGGLNDAGEAKANLAIKSTRSSPPGGFEQTMNADLAFLGQYAIQGNFNGPVIWDVSNPSNPRLVTAITCPASQNDVSVYRNLLFVSVESNTSTVDCKQMTLDTVDTRRFRGVRIFDISDIRNPRLVQNVQTCRGSHTHTVLEDPRDRDNIYVYVSGSSGMRSPTELPACTQSRPDSNDASGLWRIEIIRVPLANPAAAVVVNRANIFAGLKAMPAHAEMPADIREAQRVADSARAAGGFVARFPGGAADNVWGPTFTGPKLDSIARARGAMTPTAADSATLRANLQEMINRQFAVFAPTGPVIPGVTPISVYRQCHDITVYPSLGLGAGACEGHGILLDIRDPVNPKRLDAVADSNFAYWHSATFNNDGTKVLFSDEWGGGGAAKCRASDPKDWGADAIFEIVNNKLEFRSYYKLPAPQSALENCVAHNGSLIPIPDRDVMVQGWYQGGISVFDFTDARHPVEIAYHDRGPIDSTRFTMGGSWSAYWYNGDIVSSEIARGLDVSELTPSEYVSQNEIDAAKTVKLSYFNAQGQPKFSWPPSFALAKAYVDQMERAKCVGADRIAATRSSLQTAEAQAGAQRQATLQALITQLEGDKRSPCGAKVTKLQQTVTELSRPMVP